MNHLIREDLLNILSKKHDVLEEEFIEMNKKHGEDLRKIRNDITIFEIMKNEKLSMQRLIEELYDEIEKYCDKQIRKGDK